jgi:hypothetical protein
MPRKVPAGARLRLIFFRGKSITLLYLLWISIASLAHGSDLDQNLETINEANTIGADSQKRIDRLSGETRDLLEKYQRLVHGAEYQDSYNAELKILKEEQVSRIESLEQQIRDIQVTQQRLMPLLTGMADTLEQFILLDLPFRQEQRLSGALVLKQQLRSPGLTAPEKMRLVWEAYQKENDYGRTIETWRGPVTLNGENFSVEFLRIGRIALFYLTLDGKTARLWDKQQKQWLTLESSESRELRKAIRVADSQSAPALLQMPVMASVEEAP